MSPQRLHSSIAARMALRISSCVAAGIARSIRPMALSTKTPDGDPEASFRIRPPEGSAVADVMCASSIAFAFARTACPSILPSTTGLSGKARESSSWVGNSLLAQRV